MDKRYAIGNLICELRQEKGLTQKELGELLGVTNKAVSKWENGAALPRMAYLHELAVILGATEEELLSGCRLEEKTEAAEGSSDPQSGSGAHAERYFVCSRHEPKHVDPWTPLREQTCRHCGRRFIYKNKTKMFIACFAVTLLLAASVNFGAYLLYRRIAIPPVTLLLFTLACCASVLLTRFCIRLILAHFGKTEVVIYPDTKV